MYRVFPPFLIQEGAGHPGQHAVQDGEVHGEPGEGGGGAHGPAPGGEEEDRRAALQDAARVSIIHPTGVAKRGIRGSWPLLKYHFLYILP